MWIIGSYVKGWILSRLLEHNRHIVFKEKRVGVVGSAGVFVVFCFSKAWQQLFFCDLFSKGHIVYELKIWTHMVLEFNWGFASGAKMKMQIRIVTPSVCNLWSSSMVGQLLWQEKNRRIFGPKLNLIFRSNCYVITRYFKWWFHCCACKSEIRRASIFVTSLKNYMAEFLRHDF